MFYERLQPPFRDYIDRLLEHAETALWPERRIALEGFRRGIASCENAELWTALQALGDVVPPSDDPASALYRTLLTAYLERLGDAGEVSNPDQAILFRDSLDESQAERARRWFADHPEHDLGQ